MPVHLVQHPIAQDALLSLRDRTTRTSHFRRLAHRLSLLLAIEATRELPIVAEREWRRRSSRRTGEALDADIVVVPVLRAGLGMVEAVLELLPHARVGHIGLQRDEHTAVASRYYSKLPRDLSNSTALVVDPMLATGGSAVCGHRAHAKAGAKDIRLLCIVAAPEGIAAVEAAHPSRARSTRRSIDREFNAQKFILPGLGDFGDRLYGTPKPATRRRLRRPRRAGRRASRPSSPTASWCAGYRLDELMGRVNFGEAMYLLLTGELPTPSIGRLVDAMLVSFIDHGATPPSTLAARNAATTGASLRGSVAAGVLGFGPHYGGDVARLHASCWTTASRSRERARRIAAAATVLVDGW